jgi:hypothetical protein
MRVSRQSSAERVVLSATSVHSEFSGTGEIAAIRYGLLFEDG